MVRTATREWELTAQGWCWGHCFQRPVKLLNLLYYVLYKDNAAHALSGKLTRILLEVNWHYEFIIYLSYPFHCWGWLTMKKKSSKVFVKNIQIMPFGPRSSKPLNFLKIFIGNEKIFFRFLLVGKQFLSIFCSAYSKELLNSKPMLILALCVIPPPKNCKKCITPHLKI